MTERKMTGHAEDGSGIQKHSMGQYYPLVSVIMEVAGVHWHGVMDGRSGITLYFPTREAQESGFRHWSRIPQKEGERDSVSREEQSMEKRDKEFSVALHNSTRKKLKR